MQQDKSPHPVAGAENAGPRKIIRPAGLADRSASEASKGHPAGNGDNIFHATQWQSVLADTCITTSVIEGIAVGGRAGRLAALHMPAAGGNAARAKGSAMAARKGLPLHGPRISGLRNKKTTEAPGSVDRLCAAMRQALARSAGHQRSGGN